MSSVLDISSMYNSYSSKLSSTSADSLESALKSTKSSSDDEKLMEVCKDFESYFVQKIIEESKKTLDNEDEQGEYMQYFSDTLNQEYADIVTDNGGIGLAQQLYDSLNTDGIFLNLEELLGLSLIHI